MDITAKSIFAKLAAMMMVAGMLAVSTVVSVSGNTLAKQLAQWFEAVQDGDAETISQIVSADAVIELRDLGITLNRTEFIDSLDQWVELNAGAEILTRQVSVSDGVVTAEVCYRFPSNETYNRESYTVTEGIITASVQEKIGDNCVGF